MVIPHFWKIYHGNYIFGHVSLKFHVFEPWNYHVFQHVPLQSNVFWTFTTVISSSLIISHVFGHAPVLPCFYEHLMLMPCVWACTCLLDIAVIPCFWRVTMVKPCFFLPISHVKRHCDVCVTADHEVHLLQKLLPDLTSAGWSVSIRTH